MNAAAMRARMRGSGGKGGKMTRAAVPAAVLMAAALCGGCRRTDVLYDFDGNVIGPATHRARHAVHAARPTAAAPVSAAGRDGDAAAAADVQAP